MRQDEFNGFDSMFNLEDGFSFTNGIGRDAAEDDDDEYLFNTDDDLKPSSFKAVSEKPSPASHKTADEKPASDTFVPDPDRVFRAAPKKPLEKKERKTIRDFQMDFMAYASVCNSGKELDQLVAMFAANYDARDDKLDLMGWDILNTQKMTRKYVSLETITEISNRPTTLRNAIFKRSFLHFMETGECKFCALIGEELVEYLLDEVFQNPALLKWNCYVQRADGTRGEAYASWDKCRISSTPDALTAKFNALVRGDAASSIIAYYAMHNITLEESQLRRDFSAVVKRDCVAVTEAGVPGLVQKKTLDAIATLVRILDSLKKKGKLDIYVGKAGTGKTFEAIHNHFVPMYNGGKTLLVSLSTLVAINGAQRACKAERPTTPCSITMFNLCNRIPFMRPWVANGYKTYCIDELSQWGIEQLDTLTAIARTADASDAELVIMGDTNQIGSFLGRGNLLYMLIHNYPECVHMLTENKRADSESLVKFVWGIVDTHERDFSHYDIDDLTLKAYVHRVPDDDEMCITGSNSCAGVINMLRLEAALQRNRNDRLVSFYWPRSDQWNYYEMWNSNQEWIRARMRAKKIRVRPLENYKFGKGTCHSLDSAYDLKFLRNESCDAILVGDWTVRLLSRKLKIREGNTFIDKSAEIPWQDFITHFAPDYAMTVNKAQGLEWNHVLVVYGDAGRIDDRIPAGKSPAKNYNLNGADAAQATYVAMSRARSTLQIYTAGTQYGKQTEPLFADHMECLRTAVRREA